MSLVTEGCIKSISIDDKGDIALKIDPVEPFVFKEEKEKYVLFKDGETLRSVKVDETFICCENIIKTGFDVNSLITLKINKVKIRFTCEKAKVKMGVAKDAEEDVNEENNTDIKEVLIEKYTVTGIEIL